MSAKGCSLGANDTNPDTNETANITEYQANQEGVDDGSLLLLDEFFAEIENLNIQDENDEQQTENCITAEPKGDLEHTNATDPTRSIDGHSSPQIKQNHRKQQEKLSTIDRAEAIKDNWKKFTIAEPSSSPRTTSTGRKPISFSLGAVDASCAKKNKKKKPRSKITRRQHKHQETEFATTTSLAFGDNERTSPSSENLLATQRRDRPAPSLPHQDLVRFLPRWIAVLDTCAVLESYDSVCDLITLAKASASASAASSAVFEASNSSSRSPSSANVSQYFAFAPENVLEALTIVVPHTVWDELDYRSKEIDDEHQRYKARRAARLLTDELRAERQGLDRHQTISGATWNRDALPMAAPIRSQSRIESYHAVNEFVTLSAASTEGIANNDDKILACALCEQDRFEKAPVVNAAAATIYTTRDRPTAGGVVLITLDKVLSGKALADRLSVYSPIEFVRYYNKRMASLRSRASATSRGNYQ